MSKKIDPSEGVTPAAFGLLDAGAYIGGIGYQRIYDLIQDGTIPSLHIGRRRVILRTDLDAFLARIESGEIDGRALAVTPEERKARTKNPRPKKVAEDPRPKKVAEE